MIEMKREFDGLWTVDGIMKLVQELSMLEYMMIPLLQVRLLSYTTKFSILEFCGFLNLCIN